MGLGRSPIPNGGCTFTRAGSSCGNGNLASWHRQLGRQPAVGTGTDAWATKSQKHTDGGQTQARTAGGQSCTKSRHSQYPHGTGDAAELHRDPQKLHGDVFAVLAPVTHTAGSAPPASQRTAWQERGDMQKHKLTPPRPACCSTPLYFTNSLPQNPEFSLVCIPGHHSWFVPAHPVSPPCPPPVPSTAGPQSPCK